MKWYEFDFNISINRKKLFIFTYKRIIPKMHKKTLYPIVKNFIVKDKDVNFEKEYLKFIPEEEKYYDKNGNLLYYLKWYLPLGDKNLLHAGIEFGAKTFMKNKRPKNVILIKKEFNGEKKIHIIPCFNPIIIDLKYCEDLGLYEEIQKSTEHMSEGELRIHKMNLMEEFFFVNKSFLSMFIKDGVMKTLQESFLFDYPGQIDKITTLSITNRLIHIVPEATISLIINVLKIYSQKINYLQLELEEGKRNIKNIKEDLQDYTQRFKVLFIDTYTSYSFSDWEDLFNTISITFLLSFLSQDQKVSLISYTENIPDSLLFVIYNEHPFLRRFLARRLFLPPKLLKKLVSDPDSDVRKIIAGRKNLPKDYIIILSMDKKDKVRQKIAERGDLFSILPSKYIKNLLNDPDYEVRRSILLTIISTKKYFSQNFFLKMAKDSHPAVRAVLASIEQDIPFFILKMLANDEESYVREKLAMRKQDLPKEILEILANDKYPNISKEIATRKQKLPESVLRILANSDYTEVKHELIYRKEKLPMNILDSLSKSKSNVIRELVAGRKEDLSYDILKRLSLDSDVIKYILSQREQYLPINIIKNLLKGYDKGNKYLISAVYFNIVKRKEKLDENILGWLFLAGNNQIKFLLSKREEDFSIKMIEKLILFGEEEIKINMIKRKQFKTYPLYILEKLAMDSSLDVRIELAKSLYRLLNKDDRIKIYNILEKDPSPRVRKWLYTLDFYI